LNSGVVPLRHLRHVPPPDSITTMVYRNELTVSLCVVYTVTLNGKTGEIDLVLVTLCIQIE